MQVPFVNQVFDKDDAKGSSLRLSELLFPDAAQVEERLDVKPLTQGTTNGVTYRPVDAGDASAHDAVLVKVYGDGTDITIDRNKEELKVHQLLAENNLSSSPLVRFANGHAYQFINGRTCSVSDMANPVIYRGVAKELARWHATLPIVEPKDPQSSLEHEPSVWATAKKWLDAIPSQPTRSKADKALLRDQFHYVTGKLLLNDDKPEPLVLGHGDLLCGNIIVQDLTEPTEAASVRFIDYEGLCALIQAETSTGAIDFDYAGYAEKRLAEYWDWRRVHDGNVEADEGMSRREERWAAA
ncbi:hypothetical protein LRP88_04588 [Fusarium phalaenopsidis]